MKIGFYIDSIAGTESTINLFNQLNTAVDAQLLDDACVFYNKIEFNPVVPRFGVFNASDLWNFSGVLIATTISNVMMANNVINKFKLNYLYDQDKDFVGLLHLPKGIPVLVKNEADAAFIYRTTGKKPVIAPEDLNVAGLLQVI